MAGGISVIIPSLDPDGNLAAVVEGLLGKGFRSIILVNDGSRSENAHVFTDIARAHPEVVVLVHEVNRGKGAALKTAFRYFLDNFPDGAGVVTVDGDGQHKSEDVLECCRHMSETGNFTLGCRDFSLPVVPPRSRFGNRTTRAVLKVLFGLDISDTQTGLRAIPRECLETFTGLKGERFEYETNMLLSLNVNGFRCDEVKISTEYNNDNKGSHFRTMSDSWRIYRLILGSFFRFTASGLVCSCIDIALFALLSRVFEPAMGGSLAATAVATAAARTVSSLSNYLINRKVVFKSAAGVRNTIGRYFILAAGIMAAQALLTHGVCGLLGIDGAGTLRTLIYTAVMLVLFLASYRIQRQWVFTPSRTSL